MIPQNKAIEIYNQFKFETQSDEANKMLEDVAFFSCKIFINEMLKNCSSKKVIYWQQVHKFILEHYTNKILNVRVKHTEENNPAI